MAKARKSTFERLQKGQLNRQQRKELQRKFDADSPELDVKHPHAAGIDVGGASHFVSVPPNRDEMPVREFGSWTEDLRCMARWLKACGMETVALQSTGVYWIPVYDVLEGEGLEVYLVNARGTKNLPGRKSDVQECQWLRKLHTYGLLQPDLLFELQQVMDAYDFYRRQLGIIDKQLEEYLATLPAREPVGKVEPAQLTAKQRKKLKASRKSKDNRPAFDLGAELTRLMGVDLRIIDGIDLMTAQTIYSEVGADLSAWPTEAAWASWLELVPRNDITGGKVIKQKKRPSNNRVATALRNAAESLYRSDSYLGARYRHFTGRLEGLKGVKAMAHYLACLVYRLLTKGQAWVDRGAAYYENKRQQREMVHLQKRAAAAGMKLVPIT